MLVRFVFIYFYLFYHSYGQTIRCPTIAAIFPPSGSPTVAFRANGTFIEEVASYGVVQGGVNFGEEQIVATSNGSLEILPVSLQFLLSLSPRPRSGNVDIVFTPKARQNCSIQRGTIAFRPYGEFDVLHSVPSSCTLCQPALIVSISDKKYRFGMPFKVLTKQVGLYILLDNGYTSLSP